MYMYISYHGKKETLKGMMICKKKINKIG